MQKEPLVLPNKSGKTYFLLENNTKVYFSGDFDSGNLEKAQQLAINIYRVTPAMDKTRNTTLKNFFHFKVYGFRNCTVKFIVPRVYLLQHLIKSDGCSDCYHPIVRRYSHKPFEKVQQDVNIYYNTMHQPELSFTFTFERQNWVEFAFTYPYSYEDCEQFINEQAQIYRNHSEIYLHKEVLIKTSDNRKVHLITITNKLNLSKERMESVDGIFQEGKRPFKIDRPRIVITARVHPGEAPSSYCMEGILRFLVNEKDYRSYLLRKYFQFALIPMVNPQGVFEGMFRNDLNGDNLNRLYLHCDRLKHKSIWGIRQWLQSLDRVDFFFDLHAHPSRKGFFIYGNAFEEFLEQVEAQIFSKMLEYNCPYFQNFDCIYSQKAMVAKEKHGHHTKQGCARVYFHKQFKIIHSYTVECGYYSPTKLNRYPPQREFLTGSEYLCTEDWERVSMKEYTPESYMFMGKCLLISVLDLFHINPFSRISTSDFKSINSLRKFTAQRVYNEVERFRLVDSNCYRKIKDIANLIEQHYYLPRFKQYGLTINENYGMRHRKKTFSINPRLYKQKGQHTKREYTQQKPIKVKDKEQQLLSSPKMKDSPLKLLVIRKSSEQLQNTPSLPQLKSHQYKGLSFERQREAKSSSLVALQKQKTNLFMLNQQSEELSLALPPRKPLDKKQELSKIRKMEKQIINEIMKEKNRKEKLLRQNQSKLKFERLQPYLQTERKTKLPMIYMESQER